MQALILAAGFGKRLGKLTEKSTKCMVEFNGRRIIEYMLDSLVSAKIERIAIVIGHGGAEVQEFLGNNYQGIPIEYIENEIYAQSNNIYSVYLAGEYLQQADTILLESDLIFDENIILDCINSPAENLAVVAKYEHWMDGTVTILDELGYIKNFIGRKDFQWVNLEQYFKTVNIYKLSQRFSREIFIPLLFTYMNLQGKNDYYEEVFRIAISIKPQQIWGLSVEEKLWYEIDDTQDLDIAQTLFSDPESKFLSLQNRSGGYWRFPKIKDFSSLINPYFPCVSIIEETRSILPKIISQYPSGFETQASLVSRLFKCPVEYLILNHDYSKIVQMIMSKIPGMTGIFCSDHDAYFDWDNEKQKIVYSCLKDETLTYEIDEIVEFCRENKISNLLLVNPNKINGHFISKSDLLILLERLRGLGVTLILDESLVCFVDGSEEHSIVDLDTLQANKNLIVLKSLDIAYGIPGLRLSVAVSGDLALVQNIRDSDTFSNLNAIAEYYLQVINKYTTDFHHACEQVVREREFLVKELGAISGLELMASSRSNCLLCRIRDRETLNLIIKELLSNKILVKDYSNIPS
ncbi:MAG: aminotransferase class I/II-fold pyridoxal phosphate-dependent enzyme, partial [Cyanobacteria bacterium P01_F01_bin.143]